MKACIATFYMQNVDPRVVDAQRRVMRRFLPGDVEYYQILTESSHGEALQQFVHHSTHEIIIFFDIDAVPLSSKAIPQFIAAASRNELIGIAQRANHRRWDNHIYAAPAAMAFRKSLYVDMGEPSFLPSRRGDVAEELTRACRDREVPVTLLWPTHAKIINPRWHLRDGETYGWGTTYEDEIYHNFECREGGWKMDMFIDKCTEVLNDTP
jgi:hypothetical protein